MINITQFIDDYIKQRNHQESQSFFEGHARQKIRCLIRELIPYIGTKVIHQGRVVFLSWQHLDEYLHTLNADGTDLFNSFYANVWAVFISLAISFKSWDRSEVSFKFENDKVSSAFSELLTHILPIIGGTYPHNNDKLTELSDEQHYFCSLYAMQEEGFIANSYLADNYLLKTLRADPYDYSHTFRLGIIPGDSGRRLQNLRPHNRKPYIITPSGYVIERVHKYPMCPPHVKKEFSQIQSCTYIDENLLAQPFGFTKERNPTLYGILTHLSDARINRLLLDDCGTVSRVFDYESDQNAKASKYFFEKKTYFCLPNPLFSPHKIDNFKFYNLTRRQATGGTNEVMARLRFNPYRSFVCICSNTLESRLLAYHFSLELLDEFSEHVKRNRMSLNPKFQIPIIFYNPKKGWFRSNEPLAFYTRKMLLKDQEEARKIYTDKEVRCLQFSKFNYAFLLGLQEINLETLLEDYNGEPLALVMIKTGYVRMLLRLLQTSSWVSAKENNAKDNDLCEQLFNRLLAMGHFKKNDPLISEFILAEAFDIATKLIDATDSDKYELNAIAVRENSILFFRGFLWLYLITRGNPRQLRYMGFDKILMMAAIREMWVPIQLCIKEYPDLDKALLGKLLTPALRHGARDLARIILKASPKPNPEDSPEPLLIYSVYHEYIELIPPLIEFERQRHSYAGDDSLAYLLARDYAHFTQNEPATKLFDAVMPVIFGYNKEIICQMFFEALCLDDWLTKTDFAKQRLLHYLHKCQFLAEENNDIISALNVILDSFLDTINNTPKNSLNNAIRKLIAFLRENNALFLLESLLDSPFCERLFNNENFYLAIIHALPQDTVKSTTEFIEIVIKNNHRKAIWQKVIDQIFQHILQGYVVKPYMIEFIMRFSPGKTDQLMRFSWPILNNTKIVQYIFDHFNLTPIERDQFFEEAVCRATSTESLTVYFQNGCTVTPKSLENATYCRSQDILLALLDKIEQENFDTRFNGMAGIAFCRIWALSRDNSRLVQKLIHHLDSSYLKHLTLLDLVINNRGLIKEEYPHYPNLQYFLKGCEDLAYSSSEKSQLPQEKFLEILAIVEEYFYSVGSNAFHDIPDDNTIADAYTKILSVFETILNAWKLPTFISRSTAPINYASYMRNLMQEVDRLLTKNKFPASDSATLSNKQTDTYAHSLMMFNL